MFIHIIKNINTFFCFYFVCLQTYTPGGPSCSPNNTTNDGTSCGDNNHNLNTDSNDSSNMGDQPMNMSDDASDDDCLEYVRDHTVGLSKGIHNM